MNVNFKVSVLFLIVSLYFVIACFITWLVLFPSGHEFLNFSVTYTREKFNQTTSKLESKVNSKAMSYSQSSRLSADKFVGIVRRHHLIFLISATVIGLPPLIAIVFSEKSLPDGFSESTHETNIQVAELLKGEQLVAPEPLPPDVFLTKEVMLERPMLSGASRNWEMLNQDFTQRLLAVFKIMKEKHGYEMAIIEGYRSPERQNMLAKLGAHITNAGAFQSYHQFGMAADCAFFRNGKLIISEKDPWAMQGYKLYGEVAESAGLTWGGRWKMMDFGHAELHLPSVLKNMKQINTEL